MNMLVARVIPFLLFFVSSTLTAAGLSPEESKKFLHDSGLTELISSLPDSMGQQLDVKRLSANSSADIDTTSQAILRAAQKVDGEKIAMVYLSEAKKAEQLSGALKFLASPLGQRISKEERLASSAEAQREMQAYAQEQISSTIGEGRLQLLQDLSQALNADKVVIKLMKGVYYSVFDAVKVLNPGKAVLLKGQMDQEWQSLEPLLGQQFQSFMQMGANYSYRNLSDEDLRSYIKFLKSESGQAYWQVGVDIIDLYIQGFVSELVTLLSDRK